MYTMEHTATCVLSEAPQEPGKRAYQAHCYLCAVWSRFGVVSMDVTGFAGHFDHAGKTLGHSTHSSGPWSRWIVSVSPGRKAHCTYVSVSRCCSCCCFFLEVRFTRARREHGVQGPVSWRPTTVKWRQSSQSNHHFTIGTRQTQYHEALPSLANVQSHLTSSLADDDNASWYSVCRVPVMEWRLDCENCHHLTVVGLHDTGPRTAVSFSLLLLLVFSAVIIALMLLWWCCSADVYCSTERERVPWFWDFS